MELRICHLYPDVLNLYGDMGNVICMKKRLEWRGIKAAVTPVPIGTSDSLTDYDLFFLGGGQDFEQEVLLDDIHSGKGKCICSAVEDGLPILAICGGYQVLGSHYINHAGLRCDFLGAIDFYTESGNKRLIGDYAFSCDELPGVGTVVAFENHSGRTYLGAGSKPLGRVLRGSGNNGADGTEGVHYKNVFGSYGHGPLLPKNPALCDLILHTALVRKYGAVDFLPLGDTAEQAAHSAVLKKLRL